MPYLILAKTEGTGVPGQLVTDFSVDDGTAWPYIGINADDELWVFARHYTSFSTNRMEVEGHKYSLTGTYLGNSGARSVNGNSSHTVDSFAFNTGTSVWWTTGIGYAGGSNFRKHLMSYPSSGDDYKPDSTSHHVMSDANYNLVVLASSPRYVYLGNSDTASWTRDSSHSQSVSELDDIGNIYFYKSSTQAIVKTDQATGTSTTEYPIGQPIANRRQALEISSDGTVAYFISTDNLIYKHTFATTQTIPFITTQTATRIKLTNDDSNLLLLSSSRIYVFTT